MFFNNYEKFQGLISVMKETRAFLALPGNDFVWSSWEDQEDALSEIDSIITKLENGSLPPNISILFAPTGPVQEVSLSSEWGKSFLDLADRFDKEYANVKYQS
jgi:hypothetical protein